MHSLTHTSQKSWLVSYLRAIRLVSFHLQYIDAGLLKLTNNYSYTRR